MVKAINCVQLLRDVSIWINNKDDDENNDDDDDDDDDDEDDDNNNNRSMQIYLMNIIKICWVNWKLTLYNNEDKKINWYVLKNTNAYVW